ncbi:MAG: hypothetical protein ABR902_02805 [Candidatus Korobacteraceae bacterium]|jgi:hypothetical protein
MRTAQKLLFLLSLSSVALGQTATAPTTAPSRGLTVNASTTPVLADLDRLQAAASQANLDLGHMRIEKWKADSNSKQQAQGNADSVQRNLTTALPGLIANVRSAPQDVTSEFKLYRNLNVLYDVFVSLTESAGAFGPRNDYEALAQQLSVIDSVRRNLGDELEKLTASTQLELNQLRTQVRTLKQQAAAATPPKKVVVDDTAATKTSSRHKTKSTTKPPVSTNSAPASTGSGAAPVAKQQ